MEKPVVPAVPPHGNCTVDQKGGPRAGVLRGEARARLGEISAAGHTWSQLLREAGYRTYMSGKWHLTRNDELYNPRADSWPTARGFERHFGTLCGAGNFFSPKTLARDGRIIEEEARNDPDFYYTDAISDHAVQYIDEHFAAHADQPFFQYVAYTAPHWPLHAREEDIAKYRGRFAEGWDTLRTQRLDRMIEMGLINPAWKLTPSDPAMPPWEEAPDKPWEQRRMEVYAAQIDAMDQGIGRIIDALQRHDQLDNTLIIFLSDNGGCAEEILSPWADDFADRVSGGWTHATDGRPIQYGNNPAYMPGDESTYQSYGVAWANLSNTPFRLYKHWTHEGGIATPFIVHWPDGLDARNELRHQPAQLTDVMATLIDITGVDYPAEHAGHPVCPPEGSSLMPVLEDDSPRPDATLFFEHEGNAAVRRGKWKLVRNFTAAVSGRISFNEPGARGDWELYDMDADRSEMHNVVDEHPQLVKEMAEAYEAWANHVGVIPRDQLLAAAKAWCEQQAPK